MFSRYITVIIKLQQAVGYNFDAKLCERHLLISHNPVAGFCMLQWEQWDICHRLKTNCKMSGGRGGITGLRIDGEKSTF